MPLVFRVHDLEDRLDLRGNKPNILGTGGIEVGFQTFFSPKGKCLEYLMLCNIRVYVYLCSQTLGSQAADKPSSGLDKNVGAELGIRKH